MGKLIQRMGKGNKGMEALQAVILVGIAFFILWGVQAIWKNEVKDKMKDELVATVTGGDKSSQGSGGN